MHKIGVIKGNLHSEEVADFLGLPLITKNQVSEFDFTLSYDSQSRLCLHEVASLTRPWCLDFSEGASSFRLRQSAGAELINKAIGKKSSSVLDLMAGLGKDGFVMASYGFQMMLVEKDKIVFSLLKDALLRAQQSSELRETVSRIELVNADGLEVLSRKPSYDAIYLDPMFDVEKSAKPKKEIAALQKLLHGSGSQNLQEILKLARGYPRVVIKRPKNSPPLLPDPTHCLKGTSIRFDVYIS